MIGMPSVCKVHKDSLKSIPIGLKASKTPFSGSEIIMKTPL